jgi:hypothetical protein
MFRIRAAVACAVALPTIACAAQWKVLPQLGLSADSDTNRRLQPVERPTESAVLGGVLAIARITEVSTLAFTPRATVSRYSGEDALDSDDWGINTVYRRNGERFNFETQASVADDNTLVTELGETGFVAGNTRRRSTQASLAFTQYVGVRHVLQYQLAGSDIDYVETAGTGLVGYRYPSAGLMYAASMSPRLEATITLNAARLHVPESGLESDTQGAQIGLRFQVSERFDLAARAGYSNTSASGQSDRKPSYFGSLSWHDELSRLDIELSRDVEPSGRGVLVSADDLKVAYSRDLTERLTFDTTARVSRREDLLFGFLSNEYRYGAATMALSWKLDESWTLAFAGGYGRQEHELTNARADGRRVGLSLAWRPLQ